MLLPLVIGGLVLLINMVIQVVAVVIMLRLLDSKLESGQLRPGFRNDTMILISVLLLLFAGHSVQIAVWALLFFGFGEFEDFATSFYHSTVNFATLGYGDIVMSERWRLLGALQAASGVLMFGLSTGTLFMVTSQLFQRPRGPIGHRPPDLMSGAFITRLAAIGALGLVAGCMTVGPDLEPMTPAGEAAWSAPLAAGLEPAAEVPEQWWEIFADPVLNELVATAREQNPQLEIAALRVLEARARLGLVTGLKYPQTQVAFGDATYVAPSSSDLLEVLGIDNFWQYSLGAMVTWEADFWGRYRRGAEAAQASLDASVAAYDQAVVLLTAQVVSSYAVIRETEEQLRISRENVALQQRSYELTEVLFRNGENSELDMQQARSLLLGTQATIPTLEAALQQARNALSVLLGRPPGDLEPALARGAGLPVVPADIAVGLPADMLRRRPDVRQAELVAMAQNAVVGQATADLYPSFQLSGAISASSGGPAQTSFGDLFSGGAIAYTFGGSLVWPFLNYDRIRNNIRIEDARLQQALLNYRDTVIQAAREAEDALAALVGSREQSRVLAESVYSARRSNDLSTVRFKEGFSDYQRVLDSQQRLFTQEQRFVTSQANTVRNVVALYKALGGGWQDRRSLPELRSDTARAMRERTNWGDLISDEGT